MKKFSLIAVLIVALLAAACSKYKYETVAGDPLKTRIYTLDNGLKVYMSTNPEAPRIQTAIAVRVGGKNDPAQTTGLAHYFEHLMFKGTQSFGTSNFEAEKPLLESIEQLFEIYRQTTDQEAREAIYHQIDSISFEASKIAIPNEYDKLMAAIGASGTNAYTSQDMTVYVEDIPSNQVENWAKIQADRFRNPVLRGFHTELETVYEEKNMSLTKDSRKIWENIYAALFPNHPYGTQTVLGTQEHLKNPSLVNIRNYHKTYYVPNNMAVCVAGDFDPDQMIATIDKWFGDMSPNADIPKLQFEPETPITTPVIREVFGLEAESMLMGWRLPKATDQSLITAQIASSILYNGQAGIIDLDLNQQQKVLMAYAYVNPQPDYSSLMAAAQPKQGQTLEQLRDLLLEQITKLRDGKFDETLIKATTNNLKKELMRQFENNDGRVDMYIDSYINGSNWADEVKKLELLEKITKQDIVDWANKYLSDQNYAVIYKREGKDPNEQKIAAPKITPIATNRDSSSAFLDSIKDSKVTPINPVFVDYQKDMSQFEQRPLVNVLYKKNLTNDLFTLQYTFNTGVDNDPTINVAFDYLKYLGTDSLTSEQISSQLYALACEFSIFAGSTQSYIAISGLSENMGQAIELIEGLIINAQPNEAILANLKSDMLKSRKDAKMNQQQCFSALRRYINSGPESISRRTLSNKALEALTSQELITKTRDLMGCQHEILYYGPQSEQELQKTLEDHHKLASELKPLVRKYPEQMRTDKSQVFMAQYDAKQIYYLQYSNRGEKLDLASIPEITLYNDYFGGGMNSIVFQEMREARGLAYSAWASLISPYHKNGEYYYYAYIATQNDKMRTAIEAFDEIINTMPESEAALNIAKNSLDGRLRTERTNKIEVLNSYIAAREMGCTEDPNKQLFERSQTITLEDIKAIQSKWVKGRQYVYGILGDTKDLNKRYLETLGTVKLVSQEEIFGY